MGKQTSNDALDPRGFLKGYGKVSRRDIINIYNREILRQGAVGLKFIQSKLPEKSPTQSYIDLPEDFEINVVTVNEKMTGKSLLELDIRHLYNVTVVAVYRRGERGEQEVIIPNSDCILEWGYLLIVIGKVEDLQRLKKDFTLH